MHAEEIMNDANSIGEIISAISPLDNHSMQLMNLTAIIASKSLDEIETHIDSSLGMGIEPAMIYHAIIGVSETIGLNRALNSLKIAERLINHCK